jgi:hypothetical protein
MNSAARLTGSSSPARRCGRSYSSFFQRTMLRPCHLFSFCEISHDSTVHEQLRVGLGHGGRVHLHVGSRTWCRCRVGDVAEKNTAAVTDFSSRSMPALLQACLMIAWSSGAAG